MGLKVGFETFSGGTWKMMQLNNGNASHLKAIVVGNQDFVLKGKQHEIVRWLKDQKKPVKCAQGYGGEVWIILRNQAATASEEIAKAYGTAFGVGGIGSMIFTGVGAFTGTSDLASAIGGAVFNWSDANLDEAINKVIGKVVGKDVTVRISCARGPYRNDGLSKDTVIVLPSNISSVYCAAAVSTLK